MLFVVPGIGGVKSTENGQTCLTVSPMVQTTIRSQTKQPHFAQRMRTLKHRTWSKTAREERPLRVGAPLAGGHEGVLLALDLEVNRLNHVLDIVLNTYLIYIYIYIYPHIIPIYIRTCLETCYFSTFRIALGRNLM